MDFNSSTVRPRFQFKLSFLVSLAIAVSVVAAVFANPSMVTLGTLLSTCCGLLFFYFPRYRNQPMLVGAAAGIGMVSVIIGLVVLSVVIEAPVIQGHLYHEDGPAAFFFIAMMSWLVLSFMTALIGMLLGGMLGVLIALVDPATSAQD